MQILAELTVPTTVNYWPFLVLAISVLFVVFTIVFLRMHAFLALILAAFITGTLSNILPGGPAVSGFDVHLIAVEDETELPAEGIRTVIIGQTDDGLLQFRVFDAYRGRVVDAAETDLLNQVDELERRGELNEAERLGRQLAEIERLREQLAPLWDQTELSHAERRAVIDRVQSTFGRVLDTAQPIEASARSFGETAANIGIVIAFASIIGLCLLESGAADKIVRRFISFFGERQAGIALLASAFFLSIPVFFDTVFFLMIPLARALSLRAGKNFLLYVMAMAGGGAITHSIVPPTPGPLLVAGMLEVDLGIAIVAGVAAGLLPAVGVWYMAKWFNYSMPMTVRESAGASLADLNAIMAKRDDELPPFWLSVLPVLLPAALIAMVSFLGMARTKLPGVVEAFGGVDQFEAIYLYAEFIGNKNFALLIGAIIAIGIYLRQAGIGFARVGEKLGPALESAGIIILITSAGGAFGAMIRYSGVGDSLRTIAEGHTINYVLMAWAVAAVIRIVQGSATVAMITASALMSTVIEGAILPHHPVYIYLAIGFGSIILSWMNDSGFWVVGKLSGLSERETLKTWTLLLTGISIIGLIQTLIMASLLPLN